MKKLFKTHRYSIEGMNNKAFILNRTKNEIVAEFPVWIDNRKLVHGYDDARDFLHKQGIKAIDE